MLLAFKETVAQDYNNKKAVNGAKEQGQFTWPEPLIIDLNDKKEKHMKKALTEKQNDCE